METDHLRPPLEHTDDQHADDRVGTLGRIAGRDKLLGTAARPHGPPLLGQPRIDVGCTDSSRFVGRPPRQAVTQRGMQGLDAGHDELALERRVGKTTAHLGASLNRGPPFVGG